MGIFRANQRHEIDPRDELKPRSPGRPEGTVGDTGLDFTAWIGVAHQRLVQATTDDDPRCMRVFATEAKVAAQTACDYAVNDRQEQMSQDLVISTQRVFKIAENSPPITVPHKH